MPDLVGLRGSRRSDTEVPLAACSVTKSAFRNPARSSSLRIAASASLTSDPPTATADEQPKQV